MCTASAGTGRAALAGSAPLSGQTPAVRARQRVHGACRHFQREGPVLQHLTPRLITHFNRASNADKVPNASPTAASASSDMYGAAAADACRQLKARLQPFLDKMPCASFKVPRLNFCHVLLARGARLRTLPSGVGPQGPPGLCAVPTPALSPSLTPQEVATAAHQERVDLCAHGFYATPDVTGFGGAVPFNYLCYGGGCHAVLPGMRQLACMGRFVGRRGLEILCCAFSAASAPLSAACHACCALQAPL